MGDSDLTLALASTSLYAAARFAARAALALAKFATNAALRAGDIFFFAGAVFVAVFAALWIAAQRFFVAAEIAARPAAPSCVLAWLVSAWRLALPFLHAPLPTYVFALPSSAGVRQERTSSAAQWVLPLCGRRSQRECRKVMLEVLISENLCEVFCASNLAIAAAMISGVRWVAWRSLYSVVSVFSSFWLNTSSYTVRSRAGQVRPADCINCVTTFKFDYISTSRTMPLPRGNLTAEATSVELMTQWLEQAHYFPVPRRGIPASHIGPSLRSLG